MAFDFSTLVTDRNQQDIAYVKQLINKLVTGTATDAEKAEWNSFALKGAYNHTDLNRVTAAMEDLKLRLEGYGYAVPGYRSQKIDRPNNPTIVLPDGYTQVEYLRSSGTQYIDTGVVANYDALTIECDGTSNGTLYGTNDNIRDFQIIPNLPDTANAGSVRFNYAGEAVYLKNVPNDAVFKSDRNKCYINGELVHTFASVVSYNHGLSNYLFGRNQKGSLGNPGSATIRYCKIWVSDVLVRYFVPAKRNSDGVLGMYDTVNTVFYTNAGVGEFAAGAEMTANQYLWCESDTPTTSDMALYLANVSAIKAVLPVLSTSPNAPEDMDKLTVGEANAIEQILVDVETLIRWMLSAYRLSNAPGFYSGANPLPTLGVYYGRTWAELDALNITWDNLETLTWFQLLYNEEVTV